MRHVAKQRPVQVAWKLFSLAEINKGNEPDEAHQIGHAKGHKLERTMIAARRAGGNEALERLYMAFGEAHHGRKDDVGDEAIIRGCLEEADLPEDLYAKAQADPSTETELMAEHQVAVDELNAFGVPTIRLEGSSIGQFGPVIEPIPRGEEAVALWEWVLFSLQKEYLFEQKRVRKGPRLEAQHVID